MKRGKREKEEYTGEEEKKVKKEERRRKEKKHEVLHASADPGFVIGDAVA